MTRHHTGLRGPVVAGLLILSASSAARAAIDYSGDVSPGDPNNWTLDTDGYIGNTGIGSIGVDGGSTLNSNNLRLGQQAGSNGALAVTGAGSTWNSDQWVTAGFHGKSNIQITSGATAQLGSIALAASGSSESSIKIDGSGTTLSVTGMIKVGDYGKADLSISGGAAVTSSQGYISSNYGKTSSVTVEGIGSTWTASSGLDVVGSAYSTLTVRDRGQVNTNNMTIDANTKASVLVDGAGSNLVASGTLKVGSDDTGAFTLRNGATATLNTIHLGEFDGGQGFVNIDGPGSVLNHQIMIIGAMGKGEFRLTNGAQVNTGLATLIGRDASASGSKAIVDGAGTTWTLADKIEIGGQGAARLSVTNGAEIATRWIAVSSQSTLTMDIGTGTEIILRDSMVPGNPNIQPAFFRNDGLVRFNAAAHVAAGSYSPISVTRWQGSGTYQAIGGRWDNVTHQFIVSAAANYSAGAAMTIDLATTQRVIITDSNGKRLGLSFVASDSPGDTLTFTASTFGSEEIGSLLATGGDDMAYLAGWNVEFDGVAPTEAYVSIEIGAGQNLSDLAIWHFDGEAWTLFDADDLNYDGQFAHFLADGFSGYAVTTAAVPEPATIAILGIVAAGMLMRRRA